MKGRFTIALDDSHPRVEPGDRGILYYEPKTGTIWCRSLRTGEECNSELSTEGTTFEQVIQDAWGADPGDLQWEEEE